MRRIATLAIPFVLLVLGTTNLAPPVGPIYSIVDFGAVGGGDPFRAGANAAAINAAIVAAANPASPGVVYIPPTKVGYVVANGSVKINAPNITIRGDASMGSVSEWGATSTLIGKGAGHTLQVAQGGCTIKGLAFGAYDQSQRGTDAFIAISETQTTCRDLYMEDPNIGISHTFPWMAGGQFWVQDVLIGGQVKVAGIRSSAGNAAVYLHHVRMYNETDDQPAFGVEITSAGELMMSDCDIDNCGTNLAIIPGTEGVANQNVSAIKVVNSYFDNGNGLAQVLVQPKSNAFVANAHFTNCWTSTINNNGGAWNTNGYMVDGTKTVPPQGVKAVCDVNFIGCNAQNFLQHDGFYLIGVSGVSVVGCTGVGSYNGIQIGGHFPNMACTGTIIGSKFGNYMNQPLAGPNTVIGGNLNYGMLIEKSPGMVQGANITDGNGKGGVLIIP